MVLCSSLAPPNITSVTHEAGTTDLTCFSTGSPATNVTWTRNRQPLTIDGSRYQLTPTVTNRSLSTYENVLTISDIDRCSYTCTVTNALGNDSQTYCKFTCCCDYQLRIFSYLLDSNLITTSVVHAISMTGLLMQWYQIRCIIYLLFLPSLSPSSWSLCILTESDSNCRRIPLSRMYCHCSSGRLTVSAVDRP